MTNQSAADGTAVTFDDVDRNILRLMQVDATLSFDRLAKKVGVSKTAVWNRIQRLQQEGVILRQVVLLDPKKIGLTETFFVAIKTSRHGADWLQAFHDVVRELPEIIEVHRLAGEIDYLLKIQVGSTEKFDAFYRRLINRIELYNVTSCLSMEVIKQESALPL